jgi:excisionase family DNA binding protein
MSVTEAPPAIRWSPEAAEQLLTVKQTAKILNVSEAKVWQLLASGRIRSLKIDYSRRITPQALAEYIAAREAADTPRDAA